MCKKRGPLKVTRVWSGDLLGDLTVLLEDVAEIERHVTD